jgi:hypothetical protein
VSNRYNSLPRPFTGSSAAKIICLRSSGASAIAHKLAGALEQRIRFGRIPHWKGERRIRRCHDQSQISARFDGNHIVEPSIKPRWLPDLSKSRGRCAVSRPRQYFQINHSVFLNRRAFRGSHRLLSPDTPRLPIQSPPVTIRQKHLPAEFERFEHQKKELFQCFHAPR